MTNTIQTAKDRAADTTVTVVPAELARGFYMTNAPSLGALKLLHLMIATAAGAMAEERTHRVRLAAIRAIDGMKNHDRASITPLMQELAAAVITCDDAERQTVTIGGILDEAVIDYSQEAAGDLTIAWTFRKTFRRLAEQSQHWTILDRQTMFHLHSKYSALLFQHIQSYARYEHKDRLRLTIAELRALLAIPNGKIKRFADFRRDILMPALADINQLSRLTLKAELTKTGKTVTEVTIRWTVKDDPAPVAAELATSKVGRQARRDGTAEQIPAGRPFPAHGSTAYADNGIWRELKRNAGCTMDDGTLADKFRQWCHGKRIRLDRSDIERLFTNYCATVARSAPGGL